MYWYQEDVALSETPPHLFYNDGTPYDFSDDVGEGWRDLCIRTFGKIAGVYDKSGTDFTEFSVVQIKEKFGGLRIYCGAMDAAVFDAVQDIISAAEDESYTICEACGKPGKPRQGGWIKTLCNEHAKERSIK